MATFYYAIICITVLTSATVFGQNGDRSGSQCFHVKGVPTLKLRCPAGELIRVHSAFYGTRVDPEMSHQDQLSVGYTGDEDQVCAYRSGDNHCIQLTDMHDNCMGRYMCSVHVSNPFLMNCRTYASYMQVNYTCVPRFSIHNICQSTTISTRHGYISTPHYPDASYTSNLNCGCRLVTKDPGIRIQVIDFFVNHTQEDNCDSDYLRIGRWGRKCGTISPERLPEQFMTDTPAVNIEFFSDGQHSSRGVWLEYTGSQGGPVTLTCGPAIPRPRSPHEDEVTVQFTDRADIHIHYMIDSNEIEPPQNSFTQEFDVIVNENDYISENVIDPQEAKIYTFPERDRFFELRNEDIAYYPINNEVNREEDSYLEGDLYKHGNDRFQFDLLGSEENQITTYVNSEYQQMDSEPLVTNTVETMSYDDDTDNIYTTASDVKETVDKVYKPFEGPWNLPGVDDKSTKNFNIKGDWTNGFVQVEDMPTKESVAILSDKKNRDSSWLEDTILEPSFGASNNDEDQEIPRLYGIDTVQIITGVFVGVLILIAVIIIIVLVFRRM